MSSTRSQYGYSVLPGPSVIKYPNPSHLGCASSATLSSNLTSAFTPEKFNVNDNSVGATRQSEILYSILVNQRDPGASSYGLVTEQPPRMDVIDQMNGREEERCVTGRERPIDVFRRDSFYGEPMDIKSGLKLSNQSYNACNSFPSTSMKGQVDDSIAWGDKLAMSRTPSRDSIFSHDGSSSAVDDRKYQAHAGSGRGNEGSTRLGGEDSVELAMNQLVYLSTDSGRNSNSNSPSTTGLYAATSYRATSTKSLSLPSTPPSPPLPEMRRKNSMGNHDLKRVWQSSTYAERSERSSDHDPVDLSCKRKRSDDARNASSFNCDALRKSSDPGFMAAPDSILKAALRGRSATFSSLPVVSKYSSILETALRGRSSTFSGVRPTISLDKYRNISNSASGSTDSLHTQQRAHVQLSKRILNPVKSRILDRLNAMTSFALNLPEFIALPINDQRTLLVGAAHRLLFLFMAESNLEFVVATVHCEEATPVSTPVSDTNCDLKERLPASPVQEKIEQETGSKAPKAPQGQGRFEAPTKQFVEGVQNFISKCQAINIRPSEYFYMRWIVLFHAAIRRCKESVNAIWRLATIDEDKNRLECHDVVANLNASARQDLQEVVTDSHPDEKLRYSKLLLALHTVFGLNCNMLDALFCAPLGLKGGVEAFISESLEANQSAV